MEGEDRRREGEKRGREDVDRKREKEKKRKREEEYPPLLFRHIIFVPQAQWMSQLLQTVSL
jgi:hypothetical protein